MTRLEELPARIDDLTSQVSQLRTEMRDEFSAVRWEIIDKTDSLAAQMRMLHEDVIARIALLHEGLSVPARRKSKKA